MIKLRKLFEEKESLGTQNPGPPSYTKKIAGSLFQIRGVRQQERVGDYCVSMKQSLQNSATESRGLEYVATFLIS